MPVGSVIGCVEVLTGAPTGVGVVVVPVGVVGVPALVLVVVVWVGASGAGVVEVPDGGSRPVGGSAASAPPDSGPPSPMAVNPPPASAERITRRAAERAPFTPDMLGPCSS